MFRFDKEQLVVDIAGVKMGGQPGEYPISMADTILLVMKKKVSLIKMLLKKELKLWKKCLT